MGDKVISSSGGKWDGWAFVPIENVRAGMDCPKETAEAEIYPNRTTLTPPTFQEHSEKWAILFKI